MTLAAVLFDLDGTLVDSERESAEAMARVLERDAALQVTAAQRDFVVGHSWNEIYAKLTAEHPAFPWSRDELIARSSAERAQVIAELGMRIMPGAVAAVKRIKAKYATALVTGSSREEARQALAFLGLDGEFPVVFASEDYLRGKPAPDGYLAAASRLGCLPEACLVIEDSAAGVAAGRAAGMLVVAVRAGNFLGQDQSAAHHVVDTLDAVDDELIAVLAAGRAAS